MTTPHRVKKLTQQFESQSSGADTGGATGATGGSASFAVPGLAKGTVAGRRDRFEKGTASSTGTAPQGVDAQTELRKRTLEKHLVSSGRANAQPTPGRGKYNLGGARSADADARAEKHAGTVLHGMESATQEYQKANKPGTPLTHAVSGHGKGTDQYSRLVHGRRADELDEDRASGHVPATSVQLGPDPSGPSTPEYTTVGSDPSNVSGRFGSHMAMLHAVGEAFARADLHEQSLPEGTAPERYVTGVSGRGGGEHSGESFSLPDTAAKQKTGDAVSPAEMQQRYGQVTSTPVANSKLVLDPAKGASGKRAGWTLQTAFPTDEAQDAAWNKPRTPEDLADIRKLTATRDEKQKDVKAAQDKIVAAQKAVTAAETAIKKKEEAASKAKTPEAKKKITDTLVDAQKKVDEAKVKQQEAEQAATEAEEELKNAQSVLDAR
jgi:hypothetical protein